MQVSDRGLVALMAHEGIVPAPYADSVGVLTFGIGHTAAAGAPDPATLPMGMPANLDTALAEVAAVFRRDVVRYTADVLKAVKVPLAQHELDALVSFHYNTGAIARAELTEAPNSDDRTRAGALFLNWKKPAEIIPRRTAERDLFLHGAYPTGPATVWQVSEVGRVIWKPARTLSAAEALELVKGVDPTLHTPPDLRQPRPAQPADPDHPPEPRPLPPAGRRHLGAGAAGRPRRAGRPQQRHPIPHQRRLTMPLAVQPSAAPSNKLMAGGISAAVITSAWAEVFAAWPALSGPGMSTLAGILIALLIGYFVPDRANVPVE